MPMEQLCLSPQCGFSSTVHGNDITEDVQWAKLRLTVDAAEHIWALDPLEVAAVEQRGDAEGLDVGAQFVVRRRGEVAGLRRGEDRSAAASRRWWC